MRRSAQSLAPSLTRAVVSWKRTGELQQTLAAAVPEISGTGLHSGSCATVRLLPAAAGEGRYFAVAGSIVPATVEFAVPKTALCTELRRGDARVRTVEHLLSALEGCGVDNCRIELQGGEEVPILDGSSKQWVEAIQDVGLRNANDSCGESVERLAAELNEQISVQKDDSFIVGLPSLETVITCGVHFPKVPAIGCQWFTTCLNPHVYSRDIASSRTFCIYEEVEKLREAGLIKGGSLENALVCSITKGWLNPPLLFDNEPCRHKLLDLIGDFSLFSRNGNRGILKAHIVAYKAGHSLHTEFVRTLSERG